MLYTEKEKNEIERVRKVFAEHPTKHYFDCSGLTKWAMSGWHWPKPGILIPEEWIESAADLCQSAWMMCDGCSVMTGNDHAKKKPTRWNWPRLSGAGNPISTSCRNMRTFAMNC